MGHARLHLTFGTCLFTSLACGGGGGETGGDSSTAAPASTGAASSTTDAPTTGEGSSAAGSSSGTTGVTYGEPFTLTLLDSAWISGTDGWNTQHQDVPFDLGEGSFARATLIIDLDSDCFPFEKWSDNPPPAGQNWPATCDAFDRTMAFISDPATQDGDAPGFELLRSITPFGGPSHREVDITDYANAHPGMHTMRAYISSWPDGEGKVSGSQGGWHLSARIEVEPGPAPREVLAAISLFQGDYTADTSDLAIPFTLPPGTAKAELEYLISGHGGAQDPSSKCIGPAEEFCKRDHHVLVDGAAIAEFTAWRSDCVEYCTLTDNAAPLGPDKFCLENPCGAVSSVQAPRANWCPGAPVAPLRGPLAGAAKAPGDHDFSFVIDDVYPGGIWTVSATLYAYGG